jgi:O-6-methylguanine DNA methyltransferase
VLAPRLITRSSSDAGPGSLPLFGRQQRECLGKFVVVFGARCGGTSGSSSVGIARRTRVSTCRWTGAYPAGFRSTVLHHLPEIGYGHTATYAAVAQLAGNPKAVRAVRDACATNPLPVVVPCHRVVRSDGGMGGYLRGIEAKRNLLTLESAV